MKPFPIPVNAFGAGSQPAEEDLELEFLEMPKAEPLRTPIPPEDAAAEELAAAADVVEQLLEAMKGHRPGGSNPPRFSLKAMVPGALRALNESLGHGEVSAVVGASGDATWRIQETAFAGVWRSQREDARGVVVEDVLEAGDMPLPLKEAAAQVAGARLDGARLPAGVMNAPSIVDELRHHAKHFRPDRTAHVVNLSLLPLTPVDHQGLDAVLGEGPVAILSRGFGNCRINATNARGIWRVRYFNTMNTVILDTIEVVGLPEAARAADDDYDDSITRLVELLAWLREG